jgi:hypothetical protein
MRPRKRFCCIWEKRATSDPFGVSVIDRLDRLLRHCRCIFVRPVIPISGDRNVRCRCPALRRESCFESSRSPVLFVVILGLTTLWWTPAVVSAAYFDLVPSLTVRTEYNDNIFFSSEAETNDSIATLTPGLRIYRKSERLTLDGEGRLAVIRYADNQDLDAVDQDALGRFSWQMNERWEVAADAAYIKDSRPDRDILDTGLVQSSEPRWRRRVNLSTRYLTSETTADSFSYLYETSDYSDLESVDSEISAVQFGHTWNMRRFLNETLGRFNFGYARADFQTSKVDSYSGTVGVERDVSEVLGILCDIGLRYMDTEYIDTGTTTGAGSVKGWNGVGEVALRYRGERTNATVTFSHDVREARGRGGTTLRTELRFWLARQFTEKLKGSLSAGYYQNRTDSETVALTNIDEDTYRLQPFLTYQWNRSLFLEAAYKFTFVKDHIDGSESIQNMIYARIYWQVPIFDAERH